MLIENIRAEVKDMYPGEKWKHKVARMSDSQVMAIYYGKNNRKEKSIAKRTIREQAMPATIGLEKGIKNPSDKVHVNFEQIIFEDVMKERF